MRKGLVNSCLIQDEGIDETYGIPVQFDNYEEEGDGEDVYGEVGGYKYDILTIQ